MAESTVVNDTIAAELNSECNEKEIVDQKGATVREEFIYRVSLDMGTAEETLNRFEDTLEATLKTNEAHLDRLIAKAQHLSKLVDEIEGKIGEIDEDIAVAEGLEKKPQIVWSISLGDIGKMLMAPQDAYTDVVKDKIAADLSKLLNGVAGVPENEVTKGKIVTLCK